jgi:hypothetical protein
MTVAKLAAIIGKLQLGEPLPASNRPRDLEGLGVGPGRAEKKSALNTKAIA